MNIKIIFETETGNTQYVAQLIQTALEQAGHQVQAHSVRYDGLTLDLATQQMIIFGAPTYDDGKLEQMMQAFIDTQKDINLSGYKVAVFGLGDRTYPIFCAAADILEKWVAEHKGTLLVPSLRIDGVLSDPTLINQWVASITQALGATAK